MTNPLIYFVVASHVVITLIFLSNLFYLWRRKTQSRLHGRLSTDQPLVSILIPARNEAKNLRRLLPGLLKQQYQNFQLIIYDDASEDDTCAVIASFTDNRICTLRGSGPPEGWTGKVYALHQASRHAKGEIMLFLDADTQLKDSGALSRLVTSFQALPERSVLTSMPHYKGKGLSLVSLATHSILASIPWLFVRRLPFSSLGVLNGQCWMIDAQTYQTLQPHAQVAGEILEDVLIGRYLKKQGISPALVDVQDEVVVHMYDSFADAWRGFRKNVYLLMGNNVLLFGGIFALFATVFVVPVFLEPRLLFLIYFNKLLTDQRSGFSFTISLIAPLCYILGSTLQIDSAWNHLTGRVTWKGRPVVSV